MQFVKWIVRLLQGFQRGMPGDASYPAAKKLKLNLTSNDTTITKAGATSHDSLTSKHSSNTMSDAITSSSAPISLSKIELDIVNTIRCVLSHEKLNTVVRIAGGWVRDKIMGHACNDIDLAVDNMSGVQFAQHINQYLHQVRGEKKQKIGVIAMNPEQSKHLETATFQLHGQWIDAVNLRTESYAEGSRIPSTEIGTAKEDAMRRDLTINSLLFNINTNAIEDFTGQGLSDIKSGLIRTPLCSHTTLADDPLRSLRSIRFAGRFNFKYATELKEALSKDKIKTLLKQKVSRERIGVELHKMAFSDTSHPIICYTHLVDFGFYNVIFERPNILTEKSLQILKHRNLPNEAIHSMRCAHEYLSSHESSLSSVEQRMILFTAFMLPLHDLHFSDKKDRLFSVVEFVVCTSLKLSRKTGTDIVHLLDSVESIRQIVLAHVCAENLEIKIDDTQLVYIGNAMTTIGQCWPQAIEMALCLYHGNLLEQRRITIFAEWFRQSGLYGLWNWKPLLNGKELMSLLKIQGPAVGSAMKRQGEWRILNPQGSKDECAVALASNVN